MAEISGENGAVFYFEGLEDEGTSGTLVFTTGGKITSCGGALNFEDKGYVVGMLVTLSGCTYNLASTGDATTANNRIYTLSVVSTDSITVDEAMVAAVAEATEVTFTEAEPGIPVLGFYNWNLSYTGDVLETTDFDDSTGGRSYIPGITSWTATAEKHFLSATREAEDWLGTAVEIRFFLNYVIGTTGAPSSGNTSQYWKGDTVVTGFDETTPVDALINQSITFQGDRALALKTQDDPWSCGIS